MGRRDEDPPIAIVGGGICGLTTALALEQRGFTVDVYEATAEYQPVGAGILLQTNALVALETLGLADEICDAGRSLSDVQIRSPTGRVLQTFDLDAEQNAFGHRYVAIHRAKLLKILRQNLTSPIHNGKRCTQVSDPHRPTVHFDDGTHIDPGIVIGADGINSTVRDAITTVSKRSIDTTVFRAVTSVSLPKQHQATGFEVWGNGTYTGGAPIGDSRFYWFATAPTELAETASATDLQASFADYPEPIPAIIDALTNDEVITTGLSDLPAVPRWHCGSTVLAGDAVHGMLPFAGQGAAQSIEDAVTLAATLDSHTRVTDAFANYESRRANRADRVRAESHRLGRLGTMQSSLACRLRNTAVSILPEAVFKRFRHRRVADASVPPVAQVHTRPHNDRTGGKPSL
ncbi:FAD-dependent monooxygenase [Halobellus limi]|uniref:2-polyprenyl-6-methoxyphenol hydroxylase n=1 Tax=Halobellus limi TaxID=699433 RepID=A0A1H6BU70_9EURY|nr:FAD-dependent monooxygenase [Halobellus limi]QCC49467.1 zeaxanthin epoxidase [Halobellus limi]SEG64219.1 2-polyprenyl-6-methoxyphenol hydroxylase [Halobellus limi]